MIRRGHTHSKYTNTHRHTRKDSIIYFLLLYYWIHSVRKTAIAATNRTTSPRLPRVLDSPPKRRLRPSVVVFFYSTGLTCCESRVASMYIYYISIYSMSGITRRRSVSVTVWGIAWCVHFKLKTATSLRMRSCIACGGNYSAMTNRKKNIKLNMPRHIHVDTYLLMDIQVL